MGMYSFKTSLDLIYKHLAFPLAVKINKILYFFESHDWIYTFFLKKTIAYVNKEIPKEVNFLTAFGSKKENK